MSPGRLNLGHRGVLAAVAVVLGLSGAGVLAVALDGADGPPQPPRDAAADVVQSESEASRTGAAAAGPASPAPTAVEQVQPPSADFGPVLEASRPTGVEIPAIDLRAATLVDLEVGADGVLAAPADYGTAGWHVAGPTPGQLGPAVIAGHVDGPSGPAIFYRLGELMPGAEVTVTREDGSVAVFVIDSVERFAKADFPTSAVYGNTTNRAELRLITCGGAFDPVTGHYVDNIVVFAHLAG